MTDPRSHEFLRALPSVDEVLSSPAVLVWRSRHPRFPWTPFVRAIVDELRDGSAADGPDAADRAAITQWVIRTAEARVDALCAGGLVPVLNGTGVILHTNLGRAPIPARAAEAAVRAMRGYVSLEVDPTSGERSKRGETLNELLRWLSGAEAAMVVNNNAAAVYLAANSLSPPGRVIVSRGELVEIGGSFRLPEILRHAAAEVVEVGTTNRTYAADYEKAARAGDLLLKVHKSNYEIEGFAHEASIGELVEVGRSRGCHVVFDLGSGAFFDFAAAGVGRDPLVSGVIAKEVDGVTMSGDKLMGGVQAGIILGRRAFIDRLRQNPLRRAVRVDKVTIAALQEVARCYLFAPEPREELPVLAEVFADPAGVRGRAERVAAELRRATGRTVAVVDDEAVVGGGSLATVTVPSAAVAIRCDDEHAAVRLARALRLHSLPVFSRVRGDEIRVNMTTIRTDEDAALARALSDVLAAAR